MNAAPDLVRVAAAQYPLDAVASLVAWETKVTRWVADGVATGAQLIVFPEYGAIELAAAAGRAVTADLQATLASVADASGHAAAVWSGLARRHGVHILASSGPERRGTGYVNAARLYVPGGGFGVQEKLVLTPFEREWGVSPGAGLTVFDTAIGMLGVAICYDCEFPLTVRALAEAGAEIVAIPSCTELPSGLARVRAGAQARALESQIACIVAHTVGTAAWSAAVDRNAGRAAILVPPEPAIAMSGLLAEGVLDQPGWVAADIDLAALRLTRTTGEMRNAADWTRQPGARGLAHHARILRL